MTAQPPRPMATHTLISCMKDEGPFILEWVAHHLVLGFDRICVATNDCRDGTDHLLAALARAGHVEHIENVVPAGGIPQHAGYALMREQLGVDRTEWLMVLDADEFLNVRFGAGRVSDLTNLAGPDCDVISLHAMCFAAGTDGETEAEFSPGPICPRFAGRLALSHKANRAMKSLTRAPARFRDIHNHSLVGFSGKLRDLQVMAGDGLRRPIDPQVPLFKQLRNAPVTPGAHRMAHYNHYAVKTWDSFNLRRERGNGAVAVQDADAMRYTEDYFHDRNQVEAQDTSIARYQSEVAEKMAFLLQDPEVRRCQSDCDETHARLAAPYRRGPGAVKR